MKTVHFAATCAAACALVVACSSRADVADFEGLTEGFDDNVLVSGGITLSRPWDKLDPPDAGQIFAIDDASGAPADFPGI